MIIVAALLFQFALGTVHAWSVLRIPLTDSTGWTIPQVTLAYTLAILMLGCTAPLGALAVTKWGPRRVAFLAALLYGLGTSMAGLSEGRLWLLYVGFGAIGGKGLGISYVVPVAVLLKWFPERTGLMGGIGVAGSGAGALLAGPVLAQLVIGLGAFPTLVTVGPVYAALAGLAACFLSYPRRAVNRVVQPESVGVHPDMRQYRARDALSTWQWYGLWGVLFLNVMAGSPLLSQAAPMIEETTGVDAAAGAAFVSILSAANTIGRLAWTAISDMVGRRAVFVSMFALQSVALLIMTQATAWPVVVVLATIVVLCYGGGFGTMAAYTADYYGRMHAGPIFAMLMTACGVGAVGGQVLTACMFQATGQYRLALLSLAIATQVGCVIALLLSPPAGDKRIRASTPWAWESQRAPVESGSTHGCFVASPVAAAEAAP